MSNPIHLFENQLYFLSSKIVARNTLFYSEELINRFLEKADYYLASLCDILHFSILHDEIQLIVKIKGRESICDSYRTQTKQESLTENKIPFTTYLFSKAMSDLLVSTVKHFNYHHHRKGALISSRFTRIQIKDEKELAKYAHHMDQLEAFTPYQSPWEKIPSRYRIRKKKKVLRNLREWYDMFFSKQHKNMEESLLPSFKYWANQDLRGYRNLPSNKSLFDTYHRIQLTIYIPKSNYPP